MIIGVGSLESMVSIIVPVYNAENYLKECIESIVNQTYYNLEIILINDGSIDGSLQLCSKYAQIYSNIIIIDSDNGGVSNARNKGIKAAKGQYIVFVDADDRLELNAVEKLLSCVEKEKVDLVICGYNKCNKNNIISSIFVDEQKLSGKGAACKFWDLFHAGMINAPWNKIYHSKIIKDNNILFPTNINIGEDGYFNVKYLCFCNNVFIIKDSLYNYQDNPHQSSKKVFNNYFEMMMLNFDNIERLFKKWDLHKHTHLKKQHQVEVFNVLKHSVDQIILNNDLIIKEKIKKIRAISKNERIKNMLIIINVHGLQNQLFFKMFKYNLWYSIICIRGFQLWRRVINENKHYSTRI